MRLRHRVHTRATPAQVWQVVGQPRRWPEFEPFLTRVRGGHEQAVAGQHLLATARGISLLVPIDVLEAVPERRLVTRVHSLPGVVTEYTHQITPGVTGGCDVSVSVVVEGLFAPAAVVLVWLSAGLSARLLATRTNQLARQARAA